jgi:hypothetical protein
MRTFKFSFVCMAVLLASACSSGSSKSNAPTSTTAPITKASYLAKANAICTTMNNRVSALGDPGQDRFRLATTIDKSSEIISQTLNRLRALPTPPGESAKIAAVYATVDKVLADAPAYSAALRGTSQAAANAAGRKLQAEQEAANAASIKYGLTVCGS